MEKTFSQDLSQVMSVLILYCFEIFVHNIVHYKFNIVPEKHKSRTQSTRGDKKGERKVRGRKETNEISISLIGWSPQGLSTIVICDEACCVLQSVEVSPSTG